MLAVTNMLPMPRRLQNLIGGIDPIAGAIQPDIHQHNIGALPLGNVDRYPLSSHANRDVTQVLHSLFVLSEIKNSSSTIKIRSDRASTLA